MLTARGVKPVAVSKQEFKSTWLSGAFSPVNGNSLIMEFSGCNAETFQIFIDELSQTDPDELMIVLLDNASFHKAKTLNIPENIALIFIPAYSPELNPAEHMWQWFKRAFTNKCLKTIEDVQVFLTEQTAKMTKNLIISTCAYSYLFACEKWTAI